MQPENLRLLNNQTVASRRTYPERIVQFGAGNFLRSFVDWIIQILNDETDFASGVVVVKVTERGTYEALDAQDGLFHVVLQGIQDGQLVSQTSRINCISRTVYPYQDFAAYLDLATQPDIRFLISNTTESGIVYDASDTVTATPPSTFPAKLTQFLYHRFQHFNAAEDKGCIVLPTELIADNGTQLKKFVLQYAKQWDLSADFIAWIHNHNIFCNTLVDRIVTGYPTEQAAKLHEQLGYADKLLVAGEPYHSWIIEAPDKVRDELPVAQTSLNVKIVPDAEAYRETKVRILNGAHTSMALLGVLSGIETVRESIEHEIFGKFLHDLVYQEIIPSMDLPEDELVAFAADVFDRFKNPNIEHQLMSIALNSSSKIQARILPSIFTFHEKHGQIPTRLTLAVAAFIQVYQGEWRGQSIPIQDNPAVIEKIQRHWANSSNLNELANTILCDETLWGSDLTQLSGFVEQVATALAQFKAQGVLATLSE